MTLSYEQKYFKCHKVFNILITRFVATLSVLTLISCASGHNQAPVQDRLTYPSKKVGYHVVSEGETLFSIAWRYGLDYRQLAQRNDIAEGFTIYPGQKINLLASANKSTARSPQKPAVTRVERKSVPVSSGSRSKSTTNTGSVSTPKKSINTPIVWSWPAKGKILATFSSQNRVNKGVDISGRMGESVLAAASGVVVYAGNGIRGYGNLLIIKHNETYLSAYAHSSKLLVKEQAVVKGGQKIAELGSSGTNSSKLHFEIRREGKPVDPLRYLPAR